MGLFTFLSALAFGPDVERLGDRRFHVRQAADARLSAAGWPAYPALLAGRRSDCPERADRCDTLADRLEAPLLALLAVEGMARGLAGIPDDTPDVVLRAVCRRVDRLGGWRTPDAWVWSRTPSHQRGTVAGDCEYVAKTAAADRAVRLFFHPVK